MKMLKDTMILLFMLALFAVAASLIDTLRLKRMSEIMNQVDAAHATLEEVREVVLADQAESKAEMISEVRSIVATNNALLRMRVETIEKRLD